MIMLIWKAILDVLSEQSHVCVDEREFEETLKFSDRYD